MNQPKQFFLKNLIVFLYNIKTPTTLTRSKREYTNNKNDVWCSWEIKGRIFTSKQHRFGVSNKKKCLKKKT